MIICTSICANYLPKALTLAKSVRDHQKNAKFVICLVEETCPDLGEHAKLVDEVILAKDLGIERFDSFIFRHRIVEASTAVKGQLFVDLLKRYPDEKDFVYIDPDCRVFSQLTELEEALSKHDIVLTPHLLSPGNIDMEISTLKHGVFNLGFLAIRRSPAGEHLAQWWADRLYSFCYEDFNAGLFTDQKWMNLAPCFFDIHVLRHPGYNFATWNFLERKLSKTDGRFYVDDNYPLRFVHFSGFDGGTFDACNRKWAAPERQVFGEELANDYRTEQKKHGQDRFKKMPWSYNFFTDGQRITDSIRYYFRLADKEGLRISPFAERERLEKMQKRYELIHRFPKAHRGYRKIKSLFN